MEHIACDKKRERSVLRVIEKAAAILVFISMAVRLPAQETVWLSSLDLTKMRQGPRPLPTDKSGARTVGEPRQKKVLWLPDTSIRENPLSIGKIEFQRGVSTYVKSMLWVDLAGGSERFMAAVGVDDASQQGPFALPVNFKVFGDGKKLWESGSMQLGEPPRPVDVNLKGIKVLLLMAIANGYGAEYVQANWADARFLATGPLPKAMDAPSDAAVVLTPKPGPAPRINGPTIYGCRPGNPFLYRIPTTGMRPMQFSADHLPAGLKLDSAQGIITGSIAERGEYRATLRATNEHGNTSRPFKIVCGDKLALTPTMGWNVWFQSHYHVTDKMMREGANAMVSNGMADAGYQYVMIDDGWSNKETGDDPTRVGPPRDERGNIRPNKNFPDMKALTDHIHQKGLKAGIYSSPGPTTCNGFTASFGHEAKDAKQFADWGFDTLKYDWCSYRLISGVGPRESTDIYLRQLAAIQKPYRLMGDLVRQQNRDIVFNLCQYGMGNVWEWGAEVGGQSWRTSLDIAGYELDHIFALALKNAEYRAWSKPGSWNDPDFIQLGYHFNPRGPDSSEPCNFTPTEQYSYMSLWCLTAAPLVFSGDITKLDDFTLNVLCNPEVIEVNQDPLGQCARVISQTGDTFILIKELENGDKAVGLCNGGEWGADMVVKWSDLGLNGNQVVRDLWRQKNCGSFQNVFHAKVPAHGVVLVRISDSEE